MPAVTALSLSPHQRRALERTRRETGSGRVADRVTALLLLDSGAPTSQILSALGISRRTLQYWKQRWLRRKVFGLEDKYRSGRPPRVTPEYVRELIRTVRRDPRSLGYAFTRWTAPRLSEYLFQRTGIRLTSHWVREQLRRKGFVWRRTKRTIRNLQDAKLKERAQKQLRRLKKGLNERGQGTSSGTRTEFGSTPSR